jgi:hypothetical protein
MLYSSGLLGYPEKDSMTGSFEQIQQTKSTCRRTCYSGTGKLSQTAPAQLINTRKKYQDDRFIIGLEINNEPHHSGTLKTAYYIEG